MNKENGYEYSNINNYNNNLHGKLLNLKMMMMIRKEVKIIKYIYNQAMQYLQKWWLFNWKITDMVHVCHKNYRIGPCLLQDLQKWYMCFIKITELVHAQDWLHRNCPSVSHKVTGMVPSLRLTKLRKWSLINWIITELVHVFHEITEIASV